MSTLDLRGGEITIVAPINRDITISCSAVDEAGDPVDISAATITASLVVQRTGDTVASAWAVNKAGTPVNAFTAQISAATTTALGPGVWAFEIAVDLDGNDTQWITGTLELDPIGSGRSTNAATSVTVTTSAAVTFTVSTIGGPAGSGGGGSGTPASTVVSETTYGQAAAVGSDTEYARQDHTHGTPALPTPAAIGAATSAQGALAETAVQPADLGDLAPLDTVGTAQIDANAVTFAKIAQVATQTLVGRTTAGTGNVEALTAAQVRAILSVLVSIDEDDMVSNSDTAVPTQQSVRAYVAAQIANLLDSAPGALDTLNELAAAIGDDPNFATTVTNALAGKLTAASNLSDLTNTTTARTNLGVAIGSNVQAWSATLDLLGALTTTAFGRGLLELANAAALRTAINVEDGADVTDATNVNAAGAVMEADTSTASMAFVVDEDNMASNSATKLATQQSIKAYVDGLIAGLSATYQPLDGELTAIAGLTSAADRVPYFTGSGTAALATFSSFGRSLVDDADAAAARTTLGVVSASDTAAGIAEMATTAETKAGTDTGRTITPAGLRGFLDDFTVVEWDVNTVAASGATETLDTSAFSVHDITMDQACEFTFSNPAPSGNETEFKLYLRGAFTPTFPASVDWADGAAPTYSTPSVYVFSTVDGGTTWLGSQVGKAFA